MPFYIKIICLAISRKIGGKCVAGKEEETGDWIRPVSNFETEELYSLQKMAALFKSAQTLR